MKNVNLTNSRKRFVCLCIMNVSLGTQGSYSPGQLNWDLKEDIDISYTDVYTTHAFHGGVYFIGMCKYKLIIK